MNGNPDRRLPRYRPKGTNGWQYLLSGPVRRGLGALPAVSGNDGGIRFWQCAHPEAPIFIQAMLRICMIETEDLFFTFMERFCFVSRLKKRFGKFIEELLPILNPS
jgi:hypothetical protein